MIVVRTVPPDRHLRALTGVRFFAALAVVLAHYGNYGVASVPVEVIEFLDDGRPAVAFFFVLSGFILAYNYYGLDLGSSLRSFLVARFARIYPTLALAIVIAVPAVVIALANPEYLREWYFLPEEPALELVISLMAQITMTTAWLPFPSLNQPWNAPAWSVGAEVFFYLLFPLLVLWIRRSRAVVLAVAAACLFVLQGFGIFWMSQSFPAGIAQGLINQFPLTHLFEFVLGICVARIYLRHRAALAGRRWLREVLLAAGWSGVVVIGLTQPMVPVYYLMSPLFGVVILALALPARGRRSWLAGAGFVALGEASYALYLVHVPIGLVLLHAGVSGAWGWLAMVVVIAVSIVILRVWETPARRWIRRRLDRRTMTRREAASRGLDDPPSSR